MLKPVLQFPPHPPASARPLPVPGADPKGQRMSPARALLASGLAALLALTGCGQPETGPIEVSAIGGPPALVDPNRVALDAPAAFFTEAVAQGLVRFNAEGDIEPALAQSWIIADDGLTYTFPPR